MKHLIAVVIVLAVTACVNPGVESKTYAVRNTLTLAEQTWVRTCHDVPTLAICVDPLKQKIKDLDNKAYAAVDAAIRNPELLSFAVSAVGDFRTALGQ